VLCEIRAGLLIQTCSVSKIFLDIFLYSHSA
jgi:hypothetical protein